MAFLDLVRHPSIETDLSGLVPHWRQCDIAASLDFPDGMEWGYWLSNAVRGTLGHQLAELQSQNLARARRPDPHQRPGCYEMLFESVGSYLGRTQIPKPFTIFCDRTKNQLTITIRLFGIAEIIARDVALALENGLAQGISLRAQGGLRAPCKIHNLTMISTNRLPRIASQELDIDTFTLRFLTPLMRKSGSSFRSDTNGLLQAIYERVMGLALWNGVNLPHTPACFGKHKTPFTIQDNGIRVERWNRYSSRQPGRPIPMAGLIGDIKINGFNPDLTTLLNLGELCGIGSGTSQGLGRYELFTGI